MQQLRAGGGGKQHAGQARLRACKLDVCLASVKGGRVVDDQNQGLGLIGAGRQRFLLVAATENVSPRQNRQDRVRLGVVNGKQGNGRFH